MSKSKSQREIARELFDLLLPVSYQIAELQYGPVDASHLLCLEARFRSVQRITCDLLDSLQASGHIQQQRLSEFVMPEGGR